MELFKGRPMALIGAAAVIVSTIFCFGDTRAEVYISAAAAILVPSVMILWALKKCSGYRVFCVLIGVFAFFLIAIRSWYCFNFQPERDGKLCGENLTICGKVEECRYSSENYSVFIIEITSVDGSTASSSAVLIGNCPAELHIGSEFLLSDVFIVRMTEENDRYYSWYESEGIYLRISAESDSAFRITGEERGFYAVLRQAGQKLAASFSAYVGGDEGALCSAMILRNTSRLPEYIRRDFSRSGVSHLLSVSGLHISVLVGIIFWLLRKLRIGKTPSVVIGVVFVFFYLALIGFPVSAVRASVMLGIVYVSYFGGFDADGVNSLGIAALIILIHSPRAILDIGFILSFCATLGIVIFLPEYKKAAEKRRKEKRISERAKREKRLLETEKTDTINENDVKTENEGSDDDFVNTFTGDSPFAHLVYTVRSKIFESVLTVISAQLFTLLPISVYSGEISLAAVAANLVICPISALFLFLCLLFLPFSGIPFISRFLGFYLKKTASLILTVTSGISSMRYVSVSLFRPFAIYIITLTTAASVVLLVIKIMKKRFVMLPYAAGVLAFAVCFGVSAFGTEVRMTVLSDPISKSEGIVLTDGAGRTVLIETSDTTSSDLEFLADSARKEGATEFETLVLTHYNLRYVPDVADFLQSERVRRLWIPLPKTDADVDSALKLFEAASEKQADCECSFYGDSEPLTIFGNMSLTLSGSVSGASHSDFLLSVTGKNFEKQKKITYISFPGFEENEELTEKYIIDSDVLYLATVESVPKRLSELSGSFSGGIWIPRKDICDNYGLDEKILLRMSPDMNTENGKTVFIFGKR
ncbi:MAG: competence protein ComEC family protein [Clostridia bacterium]|nr:competence protein ComEC family protein [Clostridia bacterium]